MVKDKNTSSALSEDPYSNEERRRSVVRQISSDIKLMHQRGKTLPDAQVRNERGFNVVDFRGKLYRDRLTDEELLDIWDGLNC